MLNPKQFALSLASAVLALASIKPAGAGQVLDRIVATVNGQIILQSDWDDALRYEAFMAVRPVQDLTLAERKSALDHLIDQELLREQMRTSDAPRARSEDIAQRIGEIRKLYPGSETEAGWRSVLAQHGITDAELQSRVGLAIELMRLVEARLRPSVNIDSASIERYYNQQLLPRLQQQASGAVPLAEATPKIKELLTEEKVSELLVAWLQNLRAGSDIRTPNSTSGVAIQAQ
jgi:peptidyl-prolyl cis-trans isomerase SurA